MMRLPKTVPIPAPDPATPTVAAPAPMNFAAASMSRLATFVWIEVWGIKAVDAGITVGRQMVCGLSATRDAFLARASMFLEQFNIAIFVFVRTL